MCYFQVLALSHFADAAPSSELTPQQQLKDHYYRVKELQIQGRGTDSIQYFEVRVSICIYIYTYVNNWQSVCHDLLLYPILERRSPDDDDSDEYRDEDTVTCSDGDDLSHEHSDEHSNEDSEEDSDEDEEGLAAMLSMAEFDHYHASNGRNLSIITYVMACMIL